MMDFVLSTSRKPLLPPSEAYSLTFSTFAHPPPHIVSIAKTHIPSVAPIETPSATETPTALTHTSPSVPGTPRSAATSVSTAPPQTPPAPALTNTESSEDVVKIPPPEVSTTEETKPIPVAVPATKPAPPRSWAGLFAKPPPTSAPTTVPPQTRPVDRPPSPFIAPSNPQSLLTDPLSLSFSASPLIHPRGLVNPGNLCFANSILQVLVHTPPFYRLFIHGLAPILDGNSTTFTPGVTNRTTLLQATLGFLREFKLSSQLDLPKDPLPGEENPFAITRTKNSSKTGTSTPLTVEQLRKQSFLQDSFIPEHLYETMRENKRFETITKGHQEDAEEFLGFFLDTIHEELLFVTERMDALSNPTSTSPPPRKTSTNTPPYRAVKNKKTEDDAREVHRPLSPNQLVLALNGTGGSSSDGDSNGWMEVGKKNKVSTTRTVGGSSRDSAITKMFGGKLRSVLSVPGVAKDSATLEPYQHLQLDIQPNDVHTIEDALHHLTIPETVSVRSQSKGVDVSAKKQVLIDSLPPVLCLHLKRFVYDAREGGAGIIKSQKTIGYGKELEISPEWLSPGSRVALELINGGTQRGVKYRLSGVIYHHGKFATGGHYTLDVIRQDQSEWLRIDDTYIEPVAEEDVLVDLRKGPNAAKKGTTLMGSPKDAYLLFYQKLTI